MTFDDLVEALGKLSGQQAEAEVWGLEDGAPVAFLVGELRRVEHFDLDEPAPEAAAALRESEVAEDFFVGDAILSLWPTRFVSAEHMPNTRGWLELVTHDAVIRVGPKRIPWVD
jgi:hypothetical protein